MRWKRFWRRPLLTATQLIVLLAVIGALIIALDLNRRAKDGRLVGVGQGALQAQLDLEITRQVELEATLSYVSSDDYVAVYAREEGGFLLPDERRIVPLTIQVTPSPLPPSAPTPDPAITGRPWQAWWQLMTDAPLPAR